MQKEKEEKSNRFLFFNREIQFLQRGIEELNWNVISHLLCKNLKNTFYKLMNRITNVFQQEYHKTMNMLFH